MVCNSCGASYEDSRLKCPYCNAENEIEAYIQHVDKINEYHEKEKWYRELPSLVRSNAGKVLLALFFILVISVIIISTIGIQVQKKKDARELEKNEKAVEQLEALYQAGDYDGIESYMQECTGFSYMLRKYDEVAWLNNLYHRADGWEQVILSAKDSKECQEEYINCVHCLLNIVYSCNSCMEDRYDYKDDEAITFYKDKAQRILEDEFLLTQEEIDKYTNINVERVEASEAAQISYGRLMEK